MVIVVLCLRYVPIRGLGVSTITQIQQQLWLMNSVQRTILELEVLIGTLAIQQTCPQPVGNAFEV